MLERVSKILLVLISYCLLFICPRGKESVQIRTKGLAFVPPTGYKCILKLILLIKCAYGPVLLQLAVIS